ASLQLEARGKFVAAIVKVFGEKVENLGASMRRGSRPAKRSARRFHGVADILAIAITNLADQLAGRVEYGARIAAIGSRLLAADIHLGGLVEMARIERVAGSGLHRFGNRHRFELFLPGWLEIGTHALAATFAAIAGFLVSTKAHGRIEIIGSV